MIYRIENKKAEQDEKRTGANVLRGEWVLLFRGTTKRMDDIISLGLLTYELYKWIKRLVDVHTDFN